jgi:DNA repair photolyase
MHDFPVCIQTKSSLVVRDMDLLKRFSNIEVGVTLTTLDESVREKLEPGASSVAQRLNALSELSKNGISTWVFIGPVMPYLTEDDAIIDAIITVKPKYVLVDKLRCKEGVRDNVMVFIKEFYPQLEEKYIEIFFGNKDFFREFFKNIKQKCDKNGLKCDLSQLNK